MEVVEVIKETRDVFKLTFKDKGAIYCAPVREPNVLFSSNPEQDDWLSKGYWWLRMEGNSRRYYIVKAGVFDQRASKVLVNEIDGRSFDENTWERIAVLVVGEYDFDH